jgi:hypothetical protein
MELILATIAAGGVVGLSDQYLCMIILGVAADTGLVKLAPQVQFMGSWWFLGLMVLFWVLTNVPAYLTTVAPGVSHALHTAANVLGGFFVPVSGAFLALASAGIIADMNPELQNVLLTLRIFNLDGTIGAAGLAVAGVTGLGAATLTGMRAISKPAINISTGMAGTVAAPAHATAQNVGALVLMAAAYLLAKINPWLLVVLFVVLVLAVLAVLGWSVYQLIRLKRGLARVFDLIQTQPRAGLAVFFEFFVWGSGWLIWQKWGMGIVMPLVWGAWLTVLLSINGLAVIVLSFFPPAIPAAVFIMTGLMVLVFVAVGFNSALRLLNHLEKSGLLVGAEGQKISQAVF